MEIKPFSMKVNPEQSRIVQEFLFANEFTWYSGTKTVMNTEANYLCFSSGDLTWTNNLTPNLSFKKFEQTYMKPTELKITPDKVLSAAEKCPQAKAVLKEMFPEVFESDKSIDLSFLEGFDYRFMELRKGWNSEYNEKSFWLSPNYNWELKADRDGILCLVPTKKS